MAGHTTNQRVGEAKSKPILQYDKSGNLIAEYSSIVEAARQNGFYQQNISACCRGKCKSVGDFVWKYK